MFISILKYLFLLILLAAALLLGYSKFYQPNFHTVIEDKYYRSAQLNASALASYIDQHNIATVINLRGPNPEKEWYKQEKQVAEKYKINHFDLKLSSHKLPKIHLVAELLELLQTQPTPILFHCNGGSDRAGLASALVKLLDPQFTLEEINKETSWRYRAYSNDSTGKLFLQQYNLWLNETESEHSPKLFKKWFQDFYIDDNGNQLTSYSIHQQEKWIQIAKQTDTDIRKAYITRDSKNIHIRGWSIDLFNKTIPQKINITLSHKPVTLFQSEINSPGIAQKFGHEAFIKSSWEATQAIADLPDGCHKMRFEFTTLHYKKWLSAPKVEICIKPENPN